jgi:tRNA dimethylallyltransferase
VTVDRARNGIVWALTGCTGVGKTEWALRWAEAQNAEILSCDSLLFYRGMNIGTAKPTPDELARVPHHLIDCCDVTERMDITRFVAMAREALASIHNRGRNTLVVGGSGFYLKAFFAAVADAVEVSPAIRESVAALSMAEALERLRQLNPGGLGDLDVANPRRVARALERCIASGRSMESLAAEFAKQPSPFAEYEVRLVQLERDPKELDQRIASRVASMLQEGLVAEVQSLLKRGLRENPSAARAIGYREVTAMLDGQLQPENLAEEIVRNTRALVKKQRTWFRTQLPPHVTVDATSLTSVDALLSAALQHTR